MFISTIISRLLQSFEFFRSGFGRWLSLGLSKFLEFKIFVVPLFIWGVIRLTISLFRAFCSAVSTYFDSIHFSGIQVGGVNVLAVANTVLPIDELVGMIVAWFGLYAVCASIRFVRAAWSAVPFKAS